MDGLCVTERASPARGAVGCFSWLLYPWIKVPCMERETLGTNQKYSGFQTHFAASLWDSWAVYAHR